MNCCERTIDRMWRHDRWRPWQDHHHPLIRFRTMKRRMNPAKAIRAALVLPIWLTSVLLSAQGMNNLWMGGYESWAGPPNGGVDLDFQTGALVMTTVSRDIGYYRNSANITNAAGNLLFSTNGTFVANALGDTMLNGTGLDPGSYASTYPNGLHISQGALIIPKPGSPDIYYLFHGTIDDLVNVTATQLYLTTIDMSLAGGLGGVVTKNQPLITDQLNTGKIVAVRHANGRDWWVFCHKVDTDIFYRLLVSPFGITVDGTQAIGIPRQADGGQVCFSPDGSRFAYYWGYQDDLEIFDFDRCIGLFSNPVHILISDYDQMGGVAFSPSSRYLYVSSVKDVYQYDAEAADIASSMVHVAQWDSTYSPSPPFATAFDIAQLAPDGRIYISTGNSTFKLHVINEPDSAGLACDMEQHGITLPVWFSNSLPNHPNYHLGPVDGTGCDSLGINAGVDEITLPIAVQAFPNPSAGSFTLSYPAQSIVGEMEVRDLSGRMLLRERIPQWSTVHRVAMEPTASGLYMCRMRWKEREAIVRIIVEH